jgi:hypothetical protein
MKKGIYCTGYFPSETPESPVSHPQKSKHGVITCTKAQKSLLTKVKGKMMLEIKKKKESKIILHRLLRILGLSISASL